MNYAGIYNYDIVNGQGLRVSLYISGCDFHCPECFNQEAQSFIYGTPYTIKTREKILSLVDNPHIQGLSLLGGDPLCQSKDDLNELSILANKVKKLGKDIWIWSGFTWEELFNSFSSNKGEELDKSFARAQLIQFCDVLVDGRFDTKLKDLTLAFRGSSNQRVIDIQKTLKAREDGKNEIVFYK